MKTFTYFYPLKYKSYHPRIMKNLKFMMLLKITLNLSNLPQSQPTHATSTFKGQWMTSADVMWTLCIQISSSQQAMGGAVSKVLP